MFAYNNEILASTGHSSFFLNYGYHPQHNISSDHANWVPTAREYLEKLADAQEKAMGLLKKAQEAQAVQYNCKRWETPAFGKRKLAWLLRKYIKTKCPSTKQDNKKLRPFKILDKIRTHARRLELPATMKIHPVFHVSFLEPFRGNFKDPKISCPNPIKVNREKKYRVEKILDSRIGGRGKKRRRQYLIKWEGYPSSNKIWEDKENVKKAKALNIFLWNKKSEALKSPGKA